MTKQKNCLSLKSYQSCEKKSAAKITSEDGISFNVDILEQWKVSKKPSHRIIHISETYTITQIDQSEDSSDSEGGGVDSQQSEGGDESGESDGEDMTEEQALPLSQLIKSVENQSQIENISFSDQD